MGRKEGFEATGFSAPNRGIGDGCLLRGGDGIGDGGSISSGMCSISLLRLHERLELRLLPAGFLFG
jgi:hypothetical protein